MSFLTPLYALAALAIAAPILFHLVRRRPKEKIEFSSHLFLDPAPPRLTRSSRIENWLLLLLRGGAILLVAAAFARPYWDRAGEDKPITLGLRRILLIDTSASMRREGLIELAKEKGNEWIRKSEPGDIVAVYAFHRNLEPLLSLDDAIQLREDQRATLASRSLDLVKLTWFESDLGRSLSTALELSQGLREEDVEDAIVPTELIVLSDFQQGMSLDSLTTIAWPAGCHVRAEILTPKPPQMDNAHATLLTDTGMEESGEPEGVKNELLDKLAIDRSVPARVSNSPSSQTESFQLRWLDIGGKEIPGSNPVSTTVVRGRTQIVRMGSLPETAGTLAISGDQVSFDNHFYFTPRKPAKRLVLCVEPSRASPQESLGFFLEQIPLGNANYEVELFKIAGGSLGGFTRWEEVSLVVASGRTNTEDLQQLKAFVERGGLLLWVWDSPATGEGSSQYETLYRDLFEEELGVVSEGRIKDYSMWQQIQFSSPLFHQMADPRFSDFTKVRFWHHRKLDLAKKEDWRVLASFDNRSPAILEREFSKGRLMIFTAGWQPEESQLALSSKFVPIVLNLVTMALPKVEHATTFVAGDSIRVPAGGSLRRLPSREAIQESVSNETLIELAEPGHYLVETSEGEGVTIAVNVAIGESNVSVMDQQRLIQASVPILEEDVEKRELAMHRQLRGIELEATQGTWRWLLLLVLAIVGLESILTVKRPVANL